VTRFIKSPRAELAYAAILGFFTFGQAAFAGPVEDAQAKRSKAFNDFYSAYQNIPLSSRKTEDISQISQKTIDPADDATARAIAQENYQALKQVGMGVVNQSQADAQHAKMKAAAAKDAGLPGGPAASGARSPASGPDLGPSGGPETPRKGVTARSPKNEPVIDGSKIPLEINFGDKGVKAR
jgi:hypothetical protein